jgi:hypothetical protein
MGGGLVGRVMLASKIASDPKAPFPVPAPHPDGWREAQVPGACGLSGQAGKKVSPSEAKPEIKRTWRDCVGSCSGWPWCVLQGVRLAFSAVWGAGLERCPSPRLLDICPEINWANPFLRRIGWRVCIGGG